MKKIEKQFIFKDLDYINNEISIKIDKLNSIISFFMEEESNILENNIKEKNKNDFEEKQKVNINIGKDNEEIEDDNKFENRVNDVEMVNKLDLPDNIKSIYRKIVMITHPDKNNNNNLYNDFYKKTIDAKNNNDISEILYIAYKLNLDDIYDVEEQYFDDIKSKINDLKNRSDGINMNSFWIWYHTDNDKLKKIMVQQITKLNIN